MYLQKVDKKTDQSFQEFLAGGNVSPLPADLSMLESILLDDGVNSTFDFSSITPQLPLFSTNHYLSLPSDSVDLPGFDTHFDGQATDAWWVEFEDEAVPDVFLYRKITSDSLIWLGNGVWTDSNADGIDDPVVSVFTPGKLQASLPLELNDAWTSDFTHISTVNTPIGVVEIPGTQENHDIHVDGYGTLITHEGAYPCLRVRINQVIINADGTRQELGGWSFVTSELVQLGVFYNGLIPENPSDISFDFTQPQSISLFTSGSTDMSTAIDAGENTLPVRFVAGRNYPNPFNRETAIPIEIKETGQVRVSIFNGLGQLVDTVLDSYLPAGSYTPTWNAVDHPSGMYFYRVSLNGQSQQNIMMLLK